MGDFLLFSVFDPCKDNYHTLISNCFTCRCGSAQKQALDLHEPTKPLHHTNNSFNSSTASGSNNHQLNAPPPPSLAQPQTTTSSTSNSQHSHQSGGAEEPPLKLRITNISTLPVNSIAQAKNELVLESREQIEVEPKIDYDDLPSPSHMNTLDEEQQQQQQQQQMIGTSTLTENSPPSPSLAALALTSMAPSSDALNLHNQPDTDEETSYMERELNEQEMHLERMHEYFMQQQQQHLQQQQQQHHQHPHHHHHQQQQQHLEQFMQEGSSTNNLRQRKERMSKRQKEVYVNFLEQNPIINEHRRNDPALNRYWLKLADILNSVPQGAVKHVAEWKQTFDNWRYRVFLYARYNSKISGEEALIPKCFKPLTMTDKRAYNIWIRNPDTAPPDLEQMRNVFMNLEEAPHE